jgi:hypothetical protein
MPAHAISTSVRVGEAFEFLAAGTYILDARPGKPARCARRIVAVVAGNWTELRDSGENDSAPGAVPVNFTHDADTYKITCSAAILVYW